MNKRFQVISALLGFKTLEDFSEELGFSRKYLSILIPRGLNPRFTKRLSEKFPRAYAKPSAVVKSHYTAPPADCIKQIYELAAFIKPHIG